MSEHDHTAKCVIDFNADDTLGSVEQLVATLAPAYRAFDQASPMCVELEQSRFLGPTASVLLVGLRQLATRAGVSLQFVPPAGPPELNAYCAFAGLNSRLFERPDAEPSHPDSVTVPVQIFQGSNVSLTYPIIELVSRFVDISEDDQHALEVCVFEVLTNVADHAESDIGGVLSARFFRGRSDVRVAILDHGIGIPTSVAHHAGTDVEPHALRWALEPGNTSKRDGTNLGLGLDNLATVVTELGGELFIISQAACALVRGGTPSVRIARARLPGTLVGFRLPMGTAMMRRS